MSSNSFRNMRSVHSTQSISEGYFHSCYANNKAEKFKLRRISQGIDGIAQARLLEFRKEKRALKNLMNALDREKESCCSRQDVEADSTDELSDSDNDDSFQCSNCRNGSEEIPRKNLDMSCSMVVNIDNDDDSDGDGKEAGNDVDTNPRRKSKSHKSKKKKKRQRETREFIKEVTPFYMNHSYHHFRYDPHYDDPALSWRSESDHDMNNSENPSWRTDSNPLSIWKEKRRESLANEEKYKRFSDRFIQSCDSNPAVNGSSSTETESEEGNETTNDLGSLEILSKSIDINRDYPPTSHLDLSGLCKTCVQSLAIRDREDKSRNQNSRSSPTSHVENSLDQDEDSQQRSVLTYAERQEISKYTHKGRRRSSLTSQYSDSDENVSVSKDSINSHNYRNPTKVELWRKIVKNRLENGESIHDLASHKSFDEILEICEDDRMFPAYEPEMEFSLEDYQALRKCKYLRLSDMNVKSLKETAIRLLSK